MEILTQSKEHRRIKSISFELFKLNQKFKEQEQEYKKRKSELQNQIFAFTKKNNMTGFGFSIGNHTYNFSAVQPKSLVFDFDKLKKKLDKNIYNKIVKKEYSISNMEGLIKYLKSCGVNPKKFSSYLSVKQVVDMKQIDNLQELGELNKSDLEGCYEVKELASYVKVTDWENEEEE